ncbi:hypothetical protein N665_0383s0026 [Sinapis alba]|nr:hypothetical protein N665_0383s0026 [Sinapis alba]
MDFDYAHFALMGGREEEEEEEEEVRIRNKPSTSVQLLPKDNSASSLHQKFKPLKHPKRIPQHKGPVTSINGAHDRIHLGVGLNNGEVHIWDCETKSLLRTLEGWHYTRVGSLTWNSHILKTRGIDGQIFNNDVRIRSYVVATYRGHTQEVCGLKWSGSVHIWDRSSSTQWLHRLRGHTSAVKALAWCPFQSNLLASGDGEEDRKIKFWNTQTGACLNSVNTGSQVSSLLWSNKERELLSSHCGTGEDETLRFRMILEYLRTPKKLLETGNGQFSHVARIH